MIKILAGCGPGMVVHVCNPSYLGGRDQEDCYSRPSGQKVCEIPSTNKLGMMVHTCNPIWQEVEVGGSWSKADLGKNQETLSKK
jgi:hypothetical protein